MSKYFKTSRSGSEDGLRYAHDLGFEAVAEGPGNTRRIVGDYEYAIEIGKAIWEIDQEHSLIWHPYVERGVIGMVLANICVTHKFQTSSDYQQFINSLLNVIEEKADRHKTIDIRLEFRDSMDVIASMEYFKPTSSIRYRDETMRKSKNQKYDAWINNLLEGS